MHLRRRSAVVGAGTAVTMVAVAAMASACTNLATLNLSRTAGRPGDVVTVTGSSFRVNTRDPAASDPVLLSWNGVHGPILAEGRPDKSGNVALTFSVPEGQPGYYGLVASQRDVNWVDAYGTPARASFRILGPAGVPAVDPAAGLGAGAPSGGSSAGILALTVGLGLLGLAFFGAGFAAFLRQARRRPAAASLRLD